MSKSLVILNLTPGDGNFGAIDSSSLQESMEAIAENGKTISSAISFFSGGAVENYGSQFQWLVDDANLTTAEGHITDFIAAHTFAEIPTYTVTSASASS